MDLAIDWIPPSGQQATQQKHTIATPSPPDPPTSQPQPAKAVHPGRKAWQPPTPDLFPSPSTELTSSGRDRVHSWTSSVGVSPRGSRSSSLPAQLAKRKRRMPEIRKMSKIQPGQMPAESDAPQTLKMQPNGIALPQKVIFDPWNACTTGHQRAENRLSGSISWRESRERKLKVQLADTSGSGGRRMYDTVGAGSEHFGQDGRTENGGWVKGASGLRRKGQQSIVDCFRLDDEPPTVDDMSLQAESRCDGRIACNETETEKFSDATVHPLNPESRIGPSLNGPATKIFQNTCIYINGSTYPLISDHLLRQLIIRNGGALSIALARRSVSHVILTHKPVSDAVTSTSTSTTSTTRAIAAGGGLAAGKARKEIERKRAVGVGVKYVTAHWVIESVKAGKRLPEGRFADWRFVEKGQDDVRGFFGIAKSVDDSNNNMKRTM